MISESKQLYNRQWAIDNKEKVATYQKEYRKVWAEKNKTKIKQKKALEYRQDGLFRFALGKFKTITPKWTNLHYVKLFYRIAQEEKDIGNKVEVDHIVPLNNPLVCGLHNEWNLQVSTRQYNNTKKDRFWPDMPEYSYSDYEELYGNRV